MATYSITDARKEKVSFAGPYFVAGQDLLVRADDTSITGPDSLNGKKLCSVKGSTSAQKVKDKFAQTVQLQEFGTYSECLPALATGGVDALTTDDAILAGFAAQPENKGKFKLVGKPFSDRELRDRPEEGRHGPLPEDHGRDQEDAERRLPAEGHRRQPRPGQLQARPGQPADAGCVLLIGSDLEGGSLTSRCAVRPRRGSGLPTGEPLTH